MFWAINASREAVTGSVDGIFTMTYFTSTSDTSSDSGVPVVDVAGDVVSEGVVAVMLTVVLADENAGAFATGVTTATRRSGIVVGTSCADWVVVLSAGAKASCSIASGSNGHIPVLQNAL